VYFTASREEAEIVIDEAERFIERVRKLLKETER